MHRAREGKGGHFGRSLCLGTRVLARGGPDTVFVALLFVSRVSAFVRGYESYLSEAAGQRLVESFICMEEDAKSEVTI